MPLTDAEVLANLEPWAQDAWEKYAHRQADEITRAAVPLLVLSLRSLAEHRREVVDCCRAMKRVASAYAHYWKDSNYQDQLTDAVNALRVESSKARHFLVEKGEDDGEAERAWHAWTGD